MMVSVCVGPISVSILAVFASCVVEFLSFEGTRPAGGGVSK